MLKNIIIVADYSYIEGGAAKVAIQTAKALSKIEGLTVYFFAGSGVPCDELVNSQVIVKSLGMYDLLKNPNRFDAIIKGIYNYKAGQELKNLILNLKIEETVVHIHTWTKVLSSSVFKVCNDLGVKTFLTAHDYFLACPNGACYNFQTKRICGLRPLSIKCILCNCDARNFFHKLWRCVRQYKQNTVISNFTELNYITISKFQQKQLLGRTNFMKKVLLVENLVDSSSLFKVDCKNNNIYLFIGRICKEKGIDLYCDTITKSGANGVVIGDGPLLNEMKNRYPNILFLGWQDKYAIDYWIKKTRALLFVSAIYECSPLTVPEVMVHGIPCIVTEGNAGTDNIIDGVNGMIVSRNTDSLIAAIKRFNSDSFVEELSDNAYNFFDTKLCVEQIYADKLIRVYNSNDV